MRVKILNSNISNVRRFEFENWWTLKKSINLLIFQIVKFRKILELFNSENWQIFNFWKYLNYKNFKNFEFSKLSYIYFECS